MRYYVYALIDPRDLSPFYIGKGHSARRFNHFKDLPSDVEKSGDKAKRIKEIKDAGFKPEAVIVSWHDTDEEAYSAEQAKIKSIGLDKLTNQNCGGGGGRAKAKTAPKRLTAKQEKFCQLVASGTNASDAYRQSYDVSKMKPASVNRTATELMSNIMITSRIDELRQPAIDAVAITVETQLKKLSDLIDLAIQTDQPSAAMKGVELQSKLLDLFPATKNINENYNHDEVAQRIQEGRARLRLVSNE
jgi:hypothetical protein